MKGLRKYLVGRALVRLRKLLVKQVRRTDNKIDDLVIVFFDEFVSAYKRKA